jgi:hypothetical protein
MDYDLTSPTTTTTTEPAHQTQQSNNLQLELNTKNETQTETYEQLTDNIEIFSDDDIPIAESKNIEIITSDELEDKKIKFSGCDI